VPKKHKGQSHSTRPLSRRSPSWCRYTSEEVEALVVEGHGIMVEVEPFAHVHREGGKHPHHVGKLSEVIASPE